MMPLWTFQGFNLTLEMLIVDRVKNYTLKGYRLRFQSHT